MGAGLSSLLGGAAGGMVGGSVVHLLLDDRQFNTALSRDKATFTGSTQAMGGSASKFGTVAKAGFALAAGAVIKLGADGVQSLKALETANAQTAARIKSTGGAANVTAEQVRSMSVRLEELTAIDEVAIQQGANMLLTFTKVRNEVGKDNDIFNQANEAVLDLTTAINNGAIPSGEQLTTTAIMVGKALNNPILGLTSLRRKGVEFTEQQKEQITTLVESGKTLEAQKIILAELSKEYGGSAKAIRDTTEGELAMFGDTVEDISRSIVGGLFPAIEGIGSGLRLVLQVISPLAPFLDDALFAFLAFKGAQFLGPLLANVGRQMQLVNASMIVGARSIPAAGSALATLGRSLHLVAAGAVVAIPLVSDLVEEVERVLATPEEISREFEIATPIVKELREAAEQAAGVGLGAHITEILTPGPHIGNIYRDLHDELIGILKDITAESGLSVAEINQKLSSPAGARAFAAASQGADAFKRALQDLLGVSPNVLSASKDRKDAADDEADAHRKNADAIREERLQLLAAVGGFLGIQAASLDARDAADEYAAARRKVNQMEANGKTHTKAYQQAVADLERAELDAITSQLGLEQALLDYAQELDDAKKPQSEIIEKVKQLGKEAGLSKGDIRDLIREIKDLDKQHPTVPLDVDTSNARDAIEKFLGDMKSMGLQLSSGPVQGSPQQYKHSGGEIEGVGEVLAMLLGGEYVVNPVASKKHRGLLEAINEDRLTDYHHGGEVQPVTAFMESFGRFLESLRLLGSLKAPGVASLFGGGAGGAGGVFGPGEIVALGHAIQSLGFSVGEHPAFGGVNPVHVPGSYHYIGRAVDVNAAAGESLYEKIRLNWLAGWIQARSNPLELLYPGMGDPSHQDHLHVALARGGIADVAEAGREAILPLQSAAGTSALAEALVKAGGGITIQININAAAVEHDAVGALARQIEDRIFTRSLGLRSGT